jgi:predicted Rossmann fold flavoprotein
MKNIAIVGAGPAGLMAALSASRQGAQVTVFEKLTRPGAKLLATGGGRCNLTNLLDADSFLRAFGRQGQFMRDALKKFGRDELREFFHNQGVATFSPDDFHIFPCSEKAGDILHALLAECEKHQVKLECDLRVSSLLIAERKISGLSVNGKEENFDAVIIACGGKSYPSLGGGESGYELARQAGHEVIGPVPALAALETAEKWPGTCPGITLENSALSIDLPKLRKSPVVGTLLFTHTGISGPAVLDISGQVCALLAEMPEVTLLLNPLPDYGTADWQNLLAEWARSQPKTQLVNLLAHKFPKRLAQALCESAAEEFGRTDLATLRLSELSGIMREKFSVRMTALSLTVNKSPGFDGAMVTRGGVSLKEIAPATMQSRLVTGLFFAGEVVDLDGPCGGYNLQWAFSSGHLAGEAAAGLS